MVSRISSRWSLLYWCIAQPRRVGFGVALVLGLLMDVGDGVLLGQHALAYSVLAFAAHRAHRRMLRFSAAPQACTSCRCCCVNDVVVLAVRARRGRRFPGLALSSSGRSSARALWPLVIAAAAAAAAPRSRSRDHV